MIRSLSRLAAAGLLLGAVFAGAGLAIAAMPALAHNYPVSSTPEEGAVVTEQPGAVSLTTNDELLDLGEDDSGASLDVVDAAGRHYATGCAVLDGATVAAPATLGEPGEYTVKWRVVSTDGHPISGEFAFDWQPAADVELGEGAGEPACEALRGGGSADASQAPGAEEPAAPGIPSEAWWIGGTVLLVLVAAAATWLLTHRRPAGPDADAGASGDEPSGRG